MDYFFCACHSFPVTFIALALCFQATLDVCEDDWDTVGFPIDEEIFCQAAPWTFDVPLYASWTAIAHVSRIPSPPWCTALSDDPADFRATLVAALTVRTTTGA